MRAGAFLFELDHVAFLLCLLLYCVLGASYFWILYAYLRNRRRGEAAEAGILSKPLPSNDALPAVLVQLPTFNEGSLILRVVEAVAGLDWPREKLHVQILDDSTDGSFADSERAAAALRERSIDASAVHRDDRRGFKAGALAEGLSRSREPFIAMLDADYVPSSDFLKNCMRPLLHDEKLALVQARCDYLNGEENLVTRTQQRILDAHFLVEQAARCWSGQIVPFNGTCGIWRRAAIEDSGGWHGDTLAEDMDLSYRVQLKGWRSLFLASVTVPGELPRTLKAWRRQQFRWTKGSAEVTRKLLAAVWRAPIGLDRKLVSTLHLGGGLFGFVFGLTVATGLFDLAMGQGLTRASIALLVILAVEGIGGPAVLELVGQRFARGASVLSELRLLPQVTALRLGVGLANVGGATEALLGQGSEFVRTPKKGGATDPVRAAQV
jgi:cellulose synthase/poly-beta-1,6-N-acetylglucosamine synthase-like glycosyltransferase